VHGIGDSRITPHYSNPGVTRKKTPAVLKRQNASSKKRNGRDGKNNNKKKRGKNEKGKRQGKKKESQVKKKKTAFFLCRLSPSPFLLFLKNPFSLPPASHCPFFLFPESVVFFHFKDVQQCPVGKKKHAITD